MIKVQKLVKRFGPLTVLRELDLSVESGEFVALLGPNGAGKTTLLRILSSLARPTSGSVQVGSYILPSQGASLRANLGVVSHQPLLYGDLSAEENLQFFSKLYSVTPERISQVLELVGLYRRRDDLVRTYSRGMQQRLAIGRAILHNPSILLLDEPHTGLDQAAGEILDRILAEVALEGRTVVMTSHDLLRSSELATRLVLLSKGKIARSVLTADLDPAQLVDFYKSGVEEGS
jgi:heme exporter protein A